MRSRRTTLIGTLSLGLLCAAMMGPSGGGSNPPDSPKLVVLIAVDQLRGDLLDRYHPVFTGGFRRLLDEGYVFTQASAEHAITHTAPGHATLSTGVHPSRSGIVDNDWMGDDGGTWKQTSSVADPNAPIVGAPAMPGRSPKNLLRGGLADWIRSTDSSAEVVSISGKDRGAILLAGKARGHVYWIAPRLGRFVTSTYYRTAYPAWVTRFNETVMPALWADSSWTEALPDCWRALSRPDTAAYETDGVHTAFPHVAADEVSRGGSAAFNAWAYRQPRQDEAVLLLAQEAVERLELGQRGSVDYLAISLSATDYVGHDFGPLSREQLDNLYRLDRELGRLFDGLDASVGTGNWVVGFSADHGVMEAPEALWTMGEEAERLPYRARIRALRKAASEAESLGGGKTKVAARLARTLQSRGLAAQAYTWEDLTHAQPTDSFAVLFRNSSYPGREAGPVARWGVQARFGYHQLWRAASTGADHGSPYWYDRWVPFILLGHEVAHVRTDRAVHMVDVAPTLASLAGIEAPMDLDGHPVY